jgi:hypothetical protein
LGAEGETKIEENRAEEKRREEEEDGPTTIPAILRSATTFRATTGQPLAPYLVLLFISLHAERALCTFYKQENNHLVTMHVQ